MCLSDCQSVCCNFDALASQRAEVYATRICLIVIESYPLTLASTPASSTRLQDDSLSLSSSLALFRRSHPFDTLAKCVRQIEGQIPRAHSLDDDDNSRKTQANRYKQPLCRRTDAFVVDECCKRATDQLITLFVSAGALLPFAFRSLDDEANESARVYCRIRLLSRVLVQATWRAKQKPPLEYEKYKKTQANERNKTKPSD